MTTASFPPLDIADQWPRLNEQLVSLIDVIPDGKMNWSPRPELHNFRGIILHIALARHNWLNRIGPAEDVSAVLREGQTKDGAKQHLRSSWRRLERFITDPEKLAAAYTLPYYGEERTLRGHWVAFHLLEHDVHHRADIFHYLALLGLEHPEVETP